MSYLNFVNTNQSRIEIPTTITKNENKAIIDADVSDLPKNYTINDVLNDSLNNLFGNVSYVDISSISFDSNNNQTNLILELNAIIDGTYTFIYGNQPSLSGLNLKYTTLKTIARKLAGKLSIENPENSSRETVEIPEWSKPNNDEVDYNEYLNYQNTEDIPEGETNISSLSTNIIDVGTIQEIGEEKEEYLELIIGQIYELPLKNNHPILKSIVTNLICAELLNINYSVLNENTELEKRYFVDANSKLQMLTSGYNIELPYAKNANYDRLYRERNQPQRIKLKGETLIKQTQENYLTNFHFSIDRFDDVPDKDFPFE